MTAEIAILNKTAVALAADSAVTISVGEDQQKVYDSEDKLFELSRRDAIGVMINNNMHFMEAPLPVLIKRYRATCPRFDRIEEAALHFLDYLKGFGALATVQIAANSLEAALQPIFKVVQKRSAERFQYRLFNDESDGPDFYKNLLSNTLTEQIALMHRAIERLPETETIGERIPDDLFDPTVNGLIDRVFEGVGDEHREPLQKLGRLVLTRRVLWSAHTGVVVAGFGREELFPTLLSVEVFGMVEGQLRFYRTNHVDIDRGGVRAKVIPFAQKEMVERFLYGLDDDIERRIADFCSQSIPRIRELAVGQLDMPEEELQAFSDDIRGAEQAFLGSLREQTFDTIRQQSQDEIEDMVEFMPKSEMSKMAEALVNLTSIKRRVSRGVETVGGPIDVAVISQADGFVWVQRKHYFPGELNSRYFDRMREQNFVEEEA